MTKVDGLIEQCGNAHSKGLIGVGRGEILYILNEATAALTDLQAQVAGLREAAQEARNQALEEAELHVVFDGPPGPEAGRFVECETPDGRSINAGSWHERDDGYWELRIARALIKDQANAG